MSEKRPAGVSLTSKSKLSRTPLSGVMAPRPVTRVPAGSARRSPHGGGGAVGSRHPSAATAAGSAAATPTAYRFLELRVIRYSDVRRLELGVRVCAGQLCMSRDRHPV